MKDKQNTKAIAIIIANLIQKTKFGELRVKIENNCVTHWYITEHKKTSDLIEENAEMLLTSLVENDKL